MNIREADNVDKCALCGREDLPDNENVTRWTTEEGYFVDIPASVHVFALAGTSLGRLFICEHCYSNYHFHEFTKKDMAEVHYQFGLEYCNIDDYDKSLCSLLKSLDIDYNNPDVLSSVGYCYKNLGNKEKSKEFYRKALLIDPDHFMASENIKRLD
jgi:tetratricopeptide (TPR) repeat protein